MGRLNNFRSRVAELIDGSRDEEPEPKGYAGDDQPVGTIIGNYLEQNPQKDELQKYWELYQNVGLINGAIDNFASEVIEPGWYITADSEETVEQLTEYMENVAVVNLEHDQNFSELAWKMVVEREVRGTVFIEKVTDDQDRNQALYPLQNDTITIYTKAGKSMLPNPDDDVADPLDINQNDYGEYRVPTNDNGETGAFVQFDDIKPRWSAREQVVYTRDEIIHWPRDADIGDARGVSRIRSIQNRAEGWLQKVQDNDAAIRSKAWPMIVFKLGSEDNPWTEEQANDFLEKYDEDVLEPGLMQAVPGDLDVEEFAGETADIEAALQHDINSIMAGLPGPVYATGGFSQNVAPAVAQAQQRQFIKEVKSTRRDLENKMTPYLREVAEDYELDSPDSVEFHIGRPAGEVPPEDVSGSIIRYTSDVDQSDQDGPVTPTSSDDVVRSPEDVEDDQGNNGSESSQSGGFGDVAELEAENLEDPRFVNTSDERGVLSEQVSEYLLTAREKALTAFEDQYDDSPVAGSAAFDGVARRAMEATEQDPSVGIASRPVMEDTIEKTVETINQDNHGPSLDVSYGIRHRQRARDLSQNVQNQTRQAAEEMLNEIASQVRRGAQKGESGSTIADSIRESYDDARLESRADIISHMELQNAVNTTKLVEYDRDPDIDGVRVINTCGDGTTTVCQHLAGCGSNEQPVAWFDDEKNISTQLDAAVPDSALHNDFDPLPPAPPFHYGCSSELVPAVRE